MITSENYEEWFMLYVDNELSAADREAVERFVAGHPDLQEEWEVMSQCKLLPDQHLVFRDRDVLRKTKAAEDLHTDYFLSFIDGELDGKDIAAMEVLIRQHPHTIKELEQWRQTIAYPDATITFPDKESLYKIEGDKKLVWIPLVRIGAAAVIAGAVAFLLLLPVIRHEKAGTASAAIARATAATATGSTAAPHVVTATPAQTTTPSTTYTVAATTSSSPVSTHAAINIKKHAPAVTSIATAALHSIVDRQKKDVEQKQPGAVKNDPVKSDPVTTDVALVQPVSPGHPVMLPPPDQTLTTDRNIAVNAVILTRTNIPKEQSSFATQALQNETDAQENNSFVTGEPTDKSKLRGIFRKVTRAFGKTADRDKDGQRQVLIGAFQFALN